MLLVDGTTLPLKFEFLAWPAGQLGVEDTSPAQGGAQELAGLDVDAQLDIAAGQRGNLLPGNFPGVGSGRRP